MTRRNYRWDKGLRARVLGLVVFLLTVIVSLAAVLSTSFATLERVQQRAEQSRENILQMEQVTGDFAEMTSAVRGFLMTGQEAFYQPYGMARARLAYNMSRLQSAAERDPAQTARLYQVTELIRHYEQGIAEPEVAAKRAGQSDAGQRVAAGSGLNYIEEIRKAGRSYIDFESSRLEKELSSVSLASRNVQLATWVGAAAAALLSLTGFLVFANSITRTTGALAAAADAISRGERGVVVKDTLDGEFRQVAEAFASMSMTLAAQEQELLAQQEELVAQNEELVAQGEELQARTLLLERQDERLQRLNRLGEAMIGTIDADHLGEQIVDEYINLFGGTAGALLLAGDYTDRLIVTTERWLSPQWRGAELPATGALARCVAQQAVVTALYPETHTRIAAWKTETPVIQEVYIPLVHTGRVLAVVVVACAQPSEVSEEATALWSGIARQAAVALAAALSHQDLSRSLRLLQEQAAQVEELAAQLEEERDRASAQLDIYLSIVATMQAGAWLTDTGGNLLVVNDTYRRFFGDVPAEANLNTMLERMSAVVPPDDLFADAVRSLVASRDGSGEGTVRLHNGYVLQWFSAPVGRGSDLIGRLFTFQDVTELAKLDRLKSEFVNTVSHELRTPLTSIMGYLSLVMSEQVGPLSSTQKEFLEVVSRNTNRLGNLINDLLDIQRIESGRSPLKLQPVAVAPLVRQAADTFRVAAEQKGLALVVETPDEPGPLVTADPERLTQISANLMSNAVKYTRAGSVRVTVEDCGENVRLRIADTGIGIPPAEQPKVFEKFYRCEDKYAREAGGTGLGLSITKALVEEHGGAISLESQPGRGTAFTITLPKGS